MDRFDVNAKALDVRSVNVSDFDQIEQIRFDELFVTIYKNLKTDLKFIDTISSMSAVESFFASLAQAQESAMLLDLILKKFKNYPVEKYYRLEDVIYHFLSLMFAEELHYRPSIFFVRTNDQVEYLVISKIRPFQIENELRNVLKTLFKLHLIIYPFHSPVELIFSERHSVYHAHEYTPKYIVFDYNNAEYTVFKLFIDYLFLYTVLKQMRKHFYFTDIHFMNFFDIFIETNLAYEYSHNVLLDLSAIYPKIKFFMIAYNDKFFMYHNKQVTRLSSYLFPKDFDNSMR
jgi:hypothetical protein